MKKLALILGMLVLLSGMAFATSFTLEVHVSDGIGRPVKGVSVTFNCLEHFSDYDGERDVPRSWALSDSDASGSTKMSDYQCTAGKPASVMATYQGLNFSLPVDLHSGSNTISIVIPDLYDISVTVQDQASHPIKGVTITGTPTASGSTRPLSGTTDEKGIAVFTQVPAGSDFILRLKNGDEEKTQEATVGSKGTDYLVSMSTYPLTVSALDDMNNSLAGAIVNVSAGSYYTGLLTDSAGKAVVSGLSPGTYTLAVSYSGHLLSNNVKVDSAVSKSFDFDIHGPEITNAHIESTSSSDSMSLLAKVSDTGSGLKQVRMYYSLNQADWVEVPVTLTGSGMHKGMIPPQSKDTLISYKVTAEDNAGNPSEGAGTYTVQDKLCPLAGVLLVLPFLAFWMARRQG
jgi:hypothetical protein